MISRRQFCKTVGVGAIATCLPQASWAELDPSPFRATPNPSSEHFTVEDAMRCVEQWSADDPAYTQCLELKNYKTASLDALALLAQREWWFANFGLATLTDDLVRTLGTIPLEYMDFHHLEYASSRTIANLVSVPNDGIGFAEVESINERGIDNLRECLKYPFSLSEVMSIDGDYLLDRPTAHALAQMPMSIDLSPTLRARALTPGAWAEFTDAPHKQLQVDVWSSKETRPYVIILHHGEHRDAVIRTWDEESFEIITRKFHADFTS